MPNTTALLCHGDDRTPGCGHVVAVVDRGDVVKAGGGEILSFDRLGRARVACVCGAITVTQGRKAEGRQDESSMRAG